MTDSVVLSLEHLREVLDKVETTLCSKQRSREPNVDLFAELNLAGQESFHTRMLAFLLNPKGAHKQKARFLDLWLKCLGLPTVAERGVSERNIRIAIEYSISPDSRVDLCLWLPDSIIVVENKVFAGEGQDQLTRYQGWLQQQPQTMKTLVFLTPDGRAPRSGKGKAKPKPKPMSYGDLAVWLEECKLALSGLLEPDQELAAAISLYRRSCLALYTPEKLQMTFDDSLLKQLDEQQLKTALLLQEQMQAMRVDVFNNFWGRVKAYLEKRLDAAGYADWHCHLDGHGVTWPLLAIYEGSTFLRNDYYCVAAGNLFGLKKAPDRHAYFGITRQCNRTKVLQEKEVDLRLTADFKPDGDWVGVKPISDLPGLCSCQMTDTDDVLALHADNIAAVPDGLAGTIAKTLFELWGKHHQDLLRLNADVKRGRP